MQEKRPTALCNLQKEASLRLKILPPSWFTVKHVLKVEKALLNERNELQKALSEIKTLSGLLPICASEFFMLKFLR